MKQNKWWWWFSNDITGIFIIFVVFFVLRAIYVYSTIFQKDILIEEKNTYGSKGNNQISDSDGNIYTVNNSIYMLHWTALELFNKLDVGKKFRVKGYGKPVPMFGMIPNIVSAEEIKK